MNTLKLHNLEPSSIFWELRFFMTEKDIVNLLRIVTSWFGLTKTDLGRKALEIDCPEIFKESLIFSNRLRKQLHEELTEINNRKQNLSKEQFMRFENEREWFEFNEFEKEKAAENIQFISTATEKENKCKR